MKLQSCILALAAACSMPLPLEASEHNYYANRLTEPDSLQTLKVSGKRGRDYTIKPGEGLVINAWAKLDIATAGMNDLPTDLVLTFEMKTTGFRHEAGKYTELWLDAFQGDRKVRTRNLRVPDGDHDWREYGFPFEVNGRVTKVRFTPGNRSQGELILRNLKLKKGHVRPDLARHSNAGYRKWPGYSSTYSPDPFGRRYDKRGVSRIPFRYPFWRGTSISDSSAIVSFAGLCPRELSKDKRQDTAIPGCEALTVELPDNSQPMKYLYLLHALVDGQDGYGMEVRLTDRRGHVQTISMQYGRDLRDWKDLEQKENSRSEIPCRLNDKDELVMQSSSKFRVDPEMGAIRKIEFAPKQPPCRSIYALLDVLLSNMNYDLPSAQVLRVQEGREWKPFVFPKTKGIIAGSALDRSPAKRVKTDVTGRIIADEDGNFVFETEPGTPLRFLIDGQPSFDAHFVGPTKNYLAQRAANAAAEKGKPYYFFPPNHVCGETNDVKAQIEAAIEAKYRAGYRMIDFYGDGATGALIAKAGLDFDEYFWDLQFYTIKCLKDRGMYMNWNIGNGFYSGKPWNPETWHPERPWSKERIYVNDAHRQNWAQGVKQLLGTQNPYTGRALVDDPVLVAVNAWNEQVFNFKHKDCVRWGQQQLEKKYRRVDALKKAWGCEGEPWKRFEDISIRGNWISEDSVRGADIAEIAYERERDLFAFYRKTLHDMGFKGFVTNTNMNKSFRHILTRREATYVAQNAYHCHPMGGGYTWIGQDSAIGNEDNLIRGFLTCRAWKKPFIVTEGDIPWWNRYRYEQAFVLNAYGALNGMSAIKSFSSGGVPAVEFKAAYENFTSPRRITPFHGELDPVKMATDFLAFHIFAEGAVKTSPISFRLDISEKDIRDGRALAKSVSMEQTMFALFGRLSVDINDGTPPPSDGKEFHYPRVGGSELTRNNPKFMNIIDTRTGKFMPGKYVATCKERGWAPHGNRTDPPRHIWESSTGELYLNAKKRFGAVNTPRVQGIFAEGGTEYDLLPDLKIVKMSVSGALCAVGIDKRDLKDSERIVVVYATNALNSGMVFRKDAMNFKLVHGTLPILLQTGTFSVELTNKNADRMKAYALRPDGERYAELPLKHEPGTLLFELDTADIQNGPTVFFELMSPATAPVATDASTPTVNDEANVQPGVGDATGEPHRPTGGRAKEPAAKPKAEHGGTDWTVVAVAAVVVGVALAAWAVVAATRRGRTGRSARRTRRSGRTT